PTKESLEKNTKASSYIIESLVPETLQSQHASTSSYHVAQDRWSQNQHIELVNIIGDLGESMLTRSMVAKLTAASANECLFADFLSNIEPKKVSEALKLPRCVDAMQEKLNQFYRNKVWTLVLLAHDKIAIGSKWVFGNKKYEHGITTKNKARLVAQGYSQEEENDYDETLAPVDLLLKDTQTQTMLVETWIEKAPQMKSQLIDYVIHYKMVPIFCDNTSAIAISNNPVLHLRTKHIDIREFWCTKIASDPNLLANKTRSRLLKEYLIKFSVMNDKKPLTLDFKTFTTSTGLDYNNSEYVAYPSLEDVKAELAKFITNPSYLDKTPQMIAFCLMTGTNVYIGKINYSDLVTKLTNKSRQKYVFYPRFVSCALELLLGTQYTHDENLRVFLAS
nr:retrovirus-related Pol polyprotein from transposon TNT 1-94 [Tanacetum cinerariifolium]